MNRPATKFCADCLPSALRARAGGPLYLPATPPRRGTPRRVRVLAECSRGLHGGRGRRLAGYATGDYHDARSVRAMKAARSGLGQQARWFATENQTGGEKGVPQDGPLKEYEDRTAQGRLRSDPYQRQIIENLQDLFSRLKSYNPPPIAHPTVESVELQPKKSFFGSLFGGKKSNEPTIPENLPKGLYMYGDVGCGKTMLMDLFYETLPPNIPSKSRIHFHNFMQDVHKRMHQKKMKFGNDIDALPLVAADIAEASSVLCFDEFQCTDVADAMILRRLLESLMSHGVVLITTSNRHPDELYKNGIQRQSFIPCINLLKTALGVINLNSPTDYRKIPRPPSGVYHHPLGREADQHVQRWFDFLGDPHNDPPHPATQEVWGRKIDVPLASGRAAQFKFQQLLGGATGAADYLELVRNYDAFIITDVPGMTLNERDLARRFITFIDAVYEGRAKLVLTSAVPLTHLFISESDIKQNSNSSDGSELSDAMRMMMDDLGLSVEALKNTSIFSGDEERFAFARALSRLAEMGSKEWVERGLGVGEFIDNKDKLKSPGV